MTRIDRARYAELGYSEPMPVLDGAALSCAHEIFNAWSARGEFPVHPKHQQNLHLRFEALWRIAAAAEVRRAMRALLGPDLLLMGTKLRCKQPGETAERHFPWHQDAASWLIDPPVVHSAWIALDDNEADNAPLFVIPGSHRAGLAEHLPSPTPNLLRHKFEIPCDRVDESRAVPLLMRAGEMIVFDALLVHRSAPNGSRKRRCNLLARYVAPSTRATKAYPSILVDGASGACDFPLLAMPFALPAPSL